MAKLSLSKVLRRKKHFRTLTIVIGVLLLGIVVELLVLNNPKSLKAAVIVSGNDAVIDGGGTTTFVVDSNGNVYQQPSFKLTDNDLTTTNKEVDFRYYSYLSTPTLCLDKVCNVKGKNLTIRNGQVLMEGTQNFKNLTIENTGSISQPLADRSGMINRPVYTDDYWGMRLTGFIKIPVNSVYYLSNDTGVKDSIKIEYLNSSTIDPDTAKNNWSPIYLDANDVSKSAWSSGEKRNLTLTDYISSKQYSAFTNDSNTAEKWVPVRFSFAKGVDSAAFGIKYQIFDYYKSGDPGGFFPDIQSQIDSGYLGLSRIYGIDDNGSAQKANGVGEMNFEYFVAKDGASFLSSDFGNGVRTVESRNIDIKESLGSSYGYIGSANNTMQFAYNSLAQFSSPIGDSIATTHRIMSSRHSAFTLNPGLFPASVATWPATFKAVDNQARRVEGGLILDIDNEIKIDGERGINLNGTGYPGWGNEFYASNDYLTKVTAKSIGGGSGGGEMSSILGGGASFARRGGTPSNDILAVNFGSGKVAYGDATELISKDTLGSGGGSSGYNLGGSGGGAIKVVAKKMTVGAKNAVTANGNGGMKIGADFNIAGGSGGKIVVKTDEIALGGNIDSGTAKNEIFNVDGFGSNGSDGIVNCSGGSGGYIILAYGISNDESINSKNYNLRFHLSGGTGMLGGAASNNSFSGENGVLSVVNKSSLESASIKKWLLPIDRPMSNMPPNPNFNPYSLQFKDKIKVNLTIAGATTGFETVIEDEILKVPNSNERCKPIDGSIGVPNGATLLNSGFDTVNNKVYWNIVPNNTDAINISYDCEVVN